MAARGHHGVDTTAGNAWPKASGPTRPRDAGGQHAAPGRRRDGREEGEERAHMVLASAAAAADDCSVAAAFKMASAC